MNKEFIQIKIQQFLDEFGFTSHPRGEEVWTNEELALAMALHMFKLIPYNQLDDEK